tara:strand:- start:711 stop:1766 length:1056 start_codon:yes stop_codon:yes gene_type:complete
MKGKTILVTGSVGFIGFHLVLKLLEKGIPVVGLDNMNNYYDKNLKFSRLNYLKKLSKEKKVFFEFIEANLEDASDLLTIFDGRNLSGEEIPIPEIIVNLAAQAGVRYSLENPKAYINSNLVGFSNILEICRNSQIKHLVYASSSSVYGGNSKSPFSEKDSVDHPVSLYAATKKSNELMAHSYCHLFGFPATGLRFFTVYGPWGRPDMALFLFTKKILNDEEIDIFNNGNLFRDFTYIDDIVESLIRIIYKPATRDQNFDNLNPNPSTSWAPHRIFNIGNSRKTSLMEYISAIEKKIGKKARKNFTSMQPGDVLSTAADTSLLESWINFKPNTPIDDGIEKFINWYKDFYNV